MKIVIESVRDPEHGARFLFHGDVDNEGLHSFAGEADSLIQAFEDAKECLRTEAQHWSVPVDINARG